MKFNEINNDDKEILRNRLKERRLFLGMTYQEVADKTGISKSSLQRYETGSIKSLSFDKIFKIADALEVSPQYFTDLTKDYTGELSSDSSHQIPNISNSEYIAKIRSFEDKALQNITPILISKGYSVEQNCRGMLGDLLACKCNEVWHIDFLYVRDVNKQLTGTGARKQQLILRLGRLAIYNKPITKYSIVTERREIAEQYLKFKPTHIDIEISFIILNKNGFEELFFD